MLTVHHLDNSRSQRILWLLEELEVPYEIKKYYRAPLAAPQELQDVHLLGKSPIITDGSITLAESGAIIEYILEKYGNGQFRPKASESGYIDDLYYTHYAEGSLMPILVNRFWFRIAPERTSAFVRPIFRMVLNQLDARIVVGPLEKHKAMIEEHLADGKWFAGGAEPTVADFMMVFPLEFLDYLKGAGPNTLRYLHKVHERPAYKRGVEKGGVYTYGNA
ncbi:glutathione S-transferase-like protein [Mucidula mucida]|nr:glutathione S-transferase-like protein [Mucidula mucida]